MKNNNNFFGEVSLSTLYDDLPEIVVQAGYQLQQAIYTAMSMDYSYWKTLLTLQAGCRVKSDFVLCRELAHTWFLTETASHSAAAYQKESDRIINGLTSHMIQFRDKRTIPSGCFHAKLAFLRYTCDDPEAPEYFRIGVFSKNLTSDGDYQNICVLDGVAGEKDSPNGKRLWKYLEFCRSNTEKREAHFRNAVDQFEAIKKVRLPANCQVFFTGLDSVPVQAGPSETCLWDVMMDKWLRDTSQPKLSLNAVTKSFFVNPAGDFWGFAVRNQIPIWNCLEKGISSYSDKTHMKLYWTSCEKDEADKENLTPWELWSGSANYSSAALGRFADGRPYKRIEWTATSGGSKLCANTFGPNVECLVAIKDIPAAHRDSLLETLKDTIPEHKKMEKPPKKQTDPSRETKSAMLRCLLELKSKHTFFYWFDRRQANKDKKPVFRLRCNEIATNTGIDLKVEHSCQLPDGETVYWCAAPQSMFNRNSYQLNLQSFGVERQEVVVLALWKMTDDPAEKELVRFLFLRPEDLEPIDFAQTTKTMESIALNRVRNTPWIERFLDKSFEENRARAFEQFHTATEELAAIKELTAQKEALMKDLQVVKRFELCYKKQLLDACKAQLDALEQSIAALGEPSMDPDDKMEEDEVFCELDAEIQNIDDSFPKTAEGFRYLDVHPGWAEEAEWAVFRKDVKDLSERLRTLYSEFLDRKYI